MGIGFSVNGAEQQCLGVLGCSCRTEHPPGTACPFSDTHTLKKSSLDQGIRDTCKPSKYIGVYSTHLPIPAQVAEMVLLLEL